MPIAKTDHPTFIRAPEKGGWIALGFNGFAIKRLMKNGGLYFVSWSQNYLDPGVFYPGPVNFFDHDRMGWLHDWKPEFVSVQITGPWPAETIKGYIDYSMFENEAHFTEYANHHFSGTQGPGSVYPLYMWMATKC